MNAFLAACRRRATDYTPIWLMRQAGRYQPEYRAIREKVTFLDLCRTPELATEVTLLPVSQLGVDAAIIFADILLVLEPLGVGFEFTADDGPRIQRPVRTGEQVDGVPDTIDVDESLGYVLEAIKMTRAALPADVPLIGFAGAPFTLASYAIEGGGSKNYLHTKALMYGDEGAWNALMTKFSRAIADYLNAQIAAGANAVQLFDSWAGCLGAADYERYVAPHVRAIFRSLAADVPAIHFGTGNPELYPSMKDAGGDVIGVDWRSDLAPLWNRLGEVSVMGNLDPAYLLAPRERMFERAEAILSSVRGRAGHIFNLGHGVYPTATVDQVRALVDFVHERSAR